MYISPDTSLMQGADIVSTGLNSQGCYQCECGSLAWNFHMSCQQQASLIGCCS